MPMTDEVQVDHSHDYCGYDRGAESCGSRRDQSSKKRLTRARQWGSLPLLPAFGRCDAELMDTGLYSAPVADQQFRDRDR